MNNKEELRLRALEALLDDVMEQLEDAYDSGNMREWHRLGEQREEVGRRYKALCEKLFEEAA